MRLCGSGPSSEMTVVVRYGRTVCTFCTLLTQVPRVFGALAANLGSGSTDGGLSGIAVCSLHGCYRNNIHIVVFLVRSFTCGLFCGAGLVLCFWASSDRPPPLRRYPSVLDTGKMVAVEYEGETGLFHHRLCLRTASTAAVLNTTGRMCDSPIGLF